MTEGVMKTMLMSKLKIAVVLLAAVCTGLTARDCVKMSAATNRPRLNLTAVLPLPNRWYTVPIQGLMSRACFAIATLR